MGRVYLLQRENFEFNHEISDNIVLKFPLEEKEASDLIEIQSIIKDEISEDITEWDVKRLTEHSDYHFTGLIFCLYIDNEKVVGYGYGYNDVDESDNFYLDTIGVHPEYRGNRIGTQIKIALINNAFQKPRFNIVKTITQDDNEITIRINENLGFN